MLEGLGGIEVLCLYDVDGFFGLFMLFLKVLPLFMGVTPCFGHNIGSERVGTTSLGALSLRPRYTF